jgi:hypothetical protein
MMINKMKFNLFCCAFFLFLLVGGCSRDLSNKYSKNFNAQHKSVVIMKISEPYKNFFKKECELEANFRIVRLNDNYNDKSKRESYFFDAGGDKWMVHNSWLFEIGYDSRLAMINPGVYYIDYLSWNDGPTNYYSSSPGISKKGMIVYGAFEVKPGDVGYVGKLYIKDRTVYLEKISEIEKVKNDLIKSKQTDLVKKVKEIEFYGRGSMVHRDDNGIFILKKVENEFTTH